MESLAGVLQRFAANSKPILDGEERVKELLQDPLIQKFRQKYPELDELTLKLNMNRLYQYVKEYKTCSNCPGFELCPNDLTGHYTVLSVETVDRTYIHETKAACKKQIAEDAKQALRSKIRTFYIDDKAFYDGFSFGDILEKDLERIAAVHQINKYIELTAEQGLQNKGLYLYGSFGTGKTFLMSYMLYKFAQQGYTSAIVYMPDFVEDLKSMFGESQKLRETVEALKETDLLVFDDIGAENLNPWMRDHVLGTILNYRMNRKPTFYTSNYNLESLERHFSFTSKEGGEEAKGQRLMERIRPFVNTIEVLGSNKRG